MADTEHTPAPTPSAPRWAEEDDQDQGSSGGQRSEGPSGMGSAETSVGGADSVADTPDALPYVPSETDPATGA